MVFYLFFQPDVDSVLHLSVSQSCICELYPAGQHLCPLYQLLPEDMIHLVSVPRKKLL
ncbi:hypothetical protein HanXRQr2_Chr13g0589511 [Helianthus annuus]|uniref:Uncharacterized protein n=1 Tax=Helianthus annuus TaxID=4232 RepID=A0A9K3EI00_HELAN|nr:hypothetical protein HanXRQr2_Chr13g0589511 [Helianthus annuus]KAJ0849353.1 hypothetical protein HanPSC8_Chr13g0567801 [Helianthus annuus]